MYLGLIDQKQFEIENYKIVDLTKLRLTEKPTWDATSTIFSLAYSPDGTLIASGDCNGGTLIRLWNAITGVSEG